MGLSLRHLRSGKLRDYVKKGSTVWVLTGPLYESQMDPLPKADEEHKVPSGFWKVVMALERSKLRVATYIIPQTAKRAADVGSFKVTVNKVEGWSGMDLLLLLKDQTKLSIVDIEWMFG